MIVKILPLGLTSTFQHTIAFMISNFYESMGWFYPQQDDIHADNKH